MDQTAETVVPEPELTAEDRDIQQRALDKLEANDYDPVTAEVLRMRFQNIVSEMGTTLDQTSGSPIITEAQDFGTNILDRGGIVATGAYILFHLGAAVNILENIRDRFPEDEINEGDAFIANDPYEGAAHKQDVGVMSPFFHEGEIVNWMWTDAHMFDIGGVSPGTFSPNVTDTLGEGIMLPGLKLVEGGEIDEKVADMIKANSRLPVRVINDIRCLVAANNVARQRLQEVVERHGLEKYKLYTEIVAHLSERAFRRRLRKIPNGTYRNVDWLEHDGHEYGLFKIDCTLTVHDESLEFDFSGTDPQAGGFINTGPGGLFGNVVSPLIQILLWDITFNKGCLKAIDVKAPRGCLINAEPPAATGYGHLDAGYKLGKQVTTLISRALLRSEDKDLRNRMSAQFCDTWSIESWGGQDDEGNQFAWLNMDGGGVGGGAQSVVDGLDVAGPINIPGNKVPDCEWREQEYPGLILYRRLERNGGGPGTYRGGSGLEFAWLKYDAGSDFIGVYANQMASLPARGLGGGYPGQIGRFAIARDTDIFDQFETGNYPFPEELETDEYKLYPPKDAPIPLSDGDVVQHWVGSGAGLGDPLLRDPGTVAEEVSYGWFSPQHAENAYGVIVNPDRGTYDESATRDRREALRRKRLKGREPEHDWVGDHREVQTQDPQVSLYLAISGDETIHCLQCETELGTPEEDWREKAVSRKTEISERMDHFDMKAERWQGDGDVYLLEYFCPGCAICLETDIDHE